MVGSEDLVEAGRSRAGWWSQSEGQVLMSPVSNNLGSGTSLGWTSLEPAHGQFQRHRLTSLGLGTTSLLDRGGPLCPLSFSIENVSLMHPVWQDSIPRQVIAPSLSNLSPHRYQPRPLLLVGP